MAQPNYASAHQNIQSLNGHPKWGKCLAGGGRAPTPTATTTASSTATPSPTPPLPTPPRPHTTASPGTAVDGTPGLRAHQLRPPHPLHEYRGSRRRRGVAFVLFVRYEHAAAEMHGKVLNGRTLSSSIAEDNGRAAEFIRCRVYRDKSRCYECGEEGHLSYECPRNQLGPRERPPPSKKSRRGGGGDGSRGGGASWQSDDEDGATAFEDHRWASVVDTRGEEEEKAAGKEEGRAKAVKEKRRSYFSDESDEDED